MSSSFEELLEPQDRDALVSFQKIQHAANKLLNDEGRDSFSTATAHLRLLGMLNAQLQNHGSSKDHARNLECLLKVESLSAEKVFDQNVRELSGDVLVLSQTQSNYQYSVPPGNTRNSFERASNIIKTIFPDEAPPPSKPLEIKSTSNGISLSNPAPQTTTFRSTSNDSIQPSRPSASLQPQNVSRHNVAMDAEDVVPPMPTFNSERKYLPSVSNSFQDRGNLNGRPEAPAKNNSAPVKKAPAVVPSKKTAHINYGEVKRDEDSEPEKPEKPEKSNPFVTAKQQLVKEGNASSLTNTAAYKSKTSKSAVGAKRKQQVARMKNDEDEAPPAKKPNTKEVKISEAEKLIAEHESLTGCEPHMVEMILSELMEGTSKTTWDDIAGLEYAKQTVFEMIILPLKMPQLFKGLREPSKGLMLFGPPGTGKTMIGKAIANESSSTFFSISASTVTSKWIGEGEKMVKTLFGVARTKMPAVIFVDEIDSLLSKRAENENEASRRIKTEFLVQLDGAKVDKANDRILIIGATNRPQDLDEAVRRRLTKRLYIPLPDQKARKHLIKILCAKSDTTQLTEAEYDQAADLCEGYSGADISELMKEAAMVSMRPLLMKIDINVEDAAEIEAPPLTLADIAQAKKTISPSVGPADLKMYEEFNDQFGTFEATKGQ
eukprot:TRINITY_DN8946_c0_g1_i2.p1 TRINITY_DN8946_c0_g1~~TRINITY_DN8946_c0_g1_i2.p1  ORF type:complete len:682 (-),score=186.35 TRINITY_DN8946_c0_g1_i2:42-2024(-)